MTEGEQLILSMLSRIAFPEEKLRDLVTRNKKRPEAYVRGFNACDASRSVGEVAAVVGVTAGTLVPILQQWERLGIIYEIESQSKGKFYRHIYRLEE
jgi:hypothetical protein